jgi:acetyltransferase
MGVARDRGLEVMTGEVLSNNRKMLKMCETLGFRIARSSDDPEVVEVRRHL